jgi:uncharacterized repeat protein (TIGR03803 family)
MKIETCSAAAGFVFTCAAIAITPAPAAAQATETVLHSFGNQIPKGGFPKSRLIRDEAGNLYGTAPEGGRYGRGVVFELDTTGVETVLHNFTGGRQWGRTQTCNPGLGRQPLWDHSKRWRSRLSFKLRRGVQIGSSGPV